MITTKTGKETITSAEIKYGSLATSGTKARLAIDNFNLKFGVIITAPISNTAAVFIGDVDVTTGTGFPLVTGATLILPVEELKNIYAVSVAAQAINWIGY